jgi:hypothetical protein
MRSISEGAKRMHDGEAKRRSVMTMNVTKSNIFSSVKAEPQNAPRKHDDASLYNSIYLVAVHHKLHVMYVTHYGTWR